MHSMGGDVVGNTVEDSSSVDQFLTGGCWLGAAVASFVA